MANPTSLIEFAEQKRDTLKSALDKASKRLKIAQNANKVAIEEHKQATAKVTEANQAIAKIKRQLAVIDTPAEGEPLLKALRNAIIDHHAKSVVLTTADLVRGNASAELALAQSAFQETKREFDTAKSQLSKVKSDEKKRDDAIAAVAQPPISDILGQATAALANSDYSDAKWFIEDALPQVLRERAKERFEQAAGSLEQAYEIQVQAQVSYNTVVEGSAKIERLERTVKSAESKLFNFISRGVQDLKAAITILKRLKEVGAPVAKVAETFTNLEIERQKVLAQDPTADLDTLEDYSEVPEENQTPLQKAKKAWEDAKVDLANAAKKTDYLAKAEKDYLYDTSLEEKRNKAAKAEDKRDTANVEAAEMFTNLEIERQKVLAQDPTSDLDKLEDYSEVPEENQTPLQKAKKAWEDAKKILETEEGNFTEEMHRELNEWQAGVPEFLWKDAESFYLAEAQLNELKKNPALLVTQLENAERELLEELIPHEQQRQKIHYLSNELAQRTASAEELRKRISQRRADALRGTLKL